MLHLAQIGVCEVMKDYFQRMGRSLMLPVAVLPAAAILTGIGNWLPATWFISGVLKLAGGSILDILALLFAVGLALGMSNKKDGAVALAAVVGYALTDYVLRPENIATLFGQKITAVNAAFGTPTHNNVLFGIVSGLVAAALFDKFGQTKLPQALSFFSGKRLVPILTALAMLIFSIVMIVIWPFVYAALVAFATTIANLGWIGAGLYGFFNRLLIPTGLHHALNSVFWFKVAGINDIGNFWDSHGVLGITGRYQAGFFPIMMFGLPAGAYAIYRNALPEQKKRIGSLMLAAGVASFFTGVTEPLEFSFMFVAWPLYLIHAALTGLSLAVAAFFHWTSGFGFSAGLVDYVLAFKMPLANKPYMLLLQGVVFAILYYVIFNFAIQKFNLMTPGRDPKENDVPESTVPSRPSTEDKYLRSARVIWQALGGDNAKDNLTYLYNCTTRLRYKMTDTALADVNALKHAPGVMGVNVLDQHQIHIVIGPDVQFVADNIQNIYDGNLSPMLATPLKSSEMTTARTTTPVNHTTVESLFAVADGQLLHLEHVKDDTFASKVMGDGFAIEPINGNVLSPIDGEITMIAPTQHAIGIKTERGTDVLVHMGIDTVAMNGAPFDLKIAVGDHVKHGDLMADMNIEAIHQADKMATIMVICLELPETATVKIDDELDFDGHGGNYVGQIMY